MLLKKFTFPLIFVIGTLTACVSDNPQTSSTLPIGTFERPVSPPPLRFLKTASLCSSAIPIMWGTML